MFRERKYRIDPWPFGIALTLTVLVVYVLAGLMLDFLRPMWRFGRPDALVFAAMWLVTLVVWAVFPEYAGPDGLRGTDGIGRYHDVRWEEMRRVRSFFGFLWIDHGKLLKGLCFPTFLKDRRDFRAYVIEHAPEGNPLRTLLESHSA